MKRINKKWNERDTWYLRRNHKDLYPHEMAQHLGVSETRVRLKLARENLKTKGAIDQENKDARVLNLLYNNYTAIQIKEMTGAHINQIRRLNYTRMITANPLHGKCNPIELNPNFVPDQEETGQYTYSDLSYSEKIIYQQLN